MGEGVSCTPIGSSGSSQVETPLTKLQNSFTAHGDTLGYTHVCPLGSAVGWLFQEHVGQGRYHLGWEDLQG